MDNVQKVCHFKNESIIEPKLRTMAQAVSRRPPTGLATRSICVGFTVDRVALGQVLLRVLPTSPVSIIPSWLIIWGDEQ
jgi:hypothetical protein